VVQRLGSHGWGVTGRLPQPRSDLASATVRGRTFVIGGYDGVSAALPDVLVSSGGRFRDFARLAVPVRYAAVVAWQGSLLVFGGEVAGQELKTVQRIDLATGRVTTIGRLPTPLGHESAVALGARVLVIGGRTAADRLTDAMWWYSPRAGSFQRAGRLPTPLSDSAVVRHGSEAFLFGGERPALSDRVLRLRLRPPR
jgi:N-acetylneuraminic acid mutarotase